MISLREAGPENGYGKGYLLDWLTKNRFLVPTCKTNAVYVPMLMLCVFKLSKSSE